MKKLLNSYENVRLYIKDKTQISPKFVGIKVQFKNLRASIGFYQEKYISY